MPPKKTGANAKARGSRTPKTKRAGTKPPRAAPLSRSAKGLAKDRPVKAKQGDVVVVRIARPYLSPIGRSEVGVRRIQDAVRQVARRTTGIGILKKLDKEL
jgi:hypothetical protein